jgi:hypothetical protein
MGCLFGAAFTLFTGEALGRRKSMLVGTSILVSSRFSDELLVRDCDYRSLELHCKRRPLAWHRWLLAVSLRVLEMVRITVGYGILVSHVFGDVFIKA